MKRMMISVPDYIVDCIGEQRLLLEHMDIICKALENGTPLPEHHGDLIDRSALAGTDSDWTVIALEDILKAPTIIPATKEENLFDKMEKEFGKDWDAPKQTATEEGEQK